MSIPIAAVPVEVGDLEAGGGAVAFAVCANEPSYQNGYEQSDDAADEKIPLTSITDFSVRNGFIRKVYGILAVQLFFTFGGTVLMSIPRFGLAADAPANPIFTALYGTAMGLGLMIGATVLSFGFLLAIACCPKVRRTYPTNYVVLSLFTICQTITLGIYASYFQTASVAVCMGLTAGIVTVLTIYACTTKRDFTAMGGSLVCVLFVFVMAGWLMPLFYFVPGLGKVVHVAYACVGALIFSLYIVYDTQLIVGGTHKHSYSTDEYVFAALNLYVITIFSSLLISLSLSRSVCVCVFVQRARSE